MTRVAAWWRRIPRPARRASVAVAGSVVIAAGVIMLVIPGPGLLTLGLGIAILASEFERPRRLLRGAWSRLPAGVRGLATRRSESAR
jgi:Putative transmembrane protein (PGPGW)